MSCHAHSLDTHPPLNAGARAPSLELRETFRRSLPVPPVCTNFRAGGSLHAALPSAVSHLATNPLPENLAIWAA
jgi:hypothetical protein